MSDDERYNCRRIDEREEKLLTINTLLYQDHISVVEKGDLHALIDLEHRTGILSNYYVCQRAALLGNLDMVKHILSNGIDITKNIIHNACSSGNVDLLKYLGNCTWDSKCLLITVTNGHLEATEYLFSLGLIYSDFINLMGIAISRANIDMIKLLEANGHKIHKNHIHVAIGGCYSNISEEQYLEVAKYIYTRHTEVSSKIYKSAVSHGKLLFMQWAYEMGFPIKYRHSNLLLVNKFQHDIGLLKCGDNCLHCYVNRMKEVMRLLLVEDGYGLWLSGSVIREIVDQLV